MNEKAGKGKTYKKETLKANYIFNFISQILTLVIPLITAPYLARIFREEGSGQIAFANNIITYFTMIANLGFSTYGQREIAKHQEDKHAQSKIFWEMILLRSFCAIVSFGVLCATVFSGIYGESYTTLILMFSVQVVAVIFDVNFFYQGQEDFKSIAIRTIILRSLCLVCIFVFVKTSDDIWLYALIYSGSILLSNLAMWPQLRKRIQHIPFKELEFKKHFKPALVIFLPTLTATIYGSLDKLMIGFLCENPDYENGCYNQALKLNQTVLIIITVIDSVMVARNSNDFGNGRIDSVKTHIKFATNYVLALGIPLIVGMCLLSENLSSWYLGDGYAEVPMLLNIMSVRFIASGLACVYGNELFVAMGKEKYTTIAHICTAVANLILNFIFIPWLGAIGGAITTAIAEFADFLILFILARIKGYTSIKHTLIMSIKPIIGAACMAVPAFFINYYLNYSIWSFLIAVIAGITTYCAVMFIIKDSFFKECFDKFAKPILNKVFKRKQLQKSEQDVVSSDNDNQVENKDQGDSNDEKNDK